MHVTDYVCLDLETTGLNPKLDRITEIGAVRVRNGMQTETFQTFVNPGRKLEERITELTGITDAQLADAPEIEEVLPAFLEFMGEDILVGHSLLFDYSFLKKAAVNRKLTFEKQGIDTLKLARRYLPQLEHRSLPFLCGYYAIPHKAHRALEDAAATALLYEKLWEEFGECEDAADCFYPHGLHYQVKRDTPITPAQKERLYRLLSRHKIKVDYDVEKLTRSEASRYTDRILAEYGR